MSAWVVSSHHIDLLVSAAIDHEICLDFYKPGTLETVTEANAQALGLMLWAENIRSVVYRYNLSGTDEGEQYKLDLASYRFRRYAELRASAVASALACYDYQSCECPDYRETAAASFVQQLGRAIGDEPRGYESEPWGFDTEAQVQAAQAGAA
jgi:hypothetical protein